MVFANNWGIDPKSLIDSSPAFDRIGMCWVRDVPTNAALINEKFKRLLFVKWSRVLSWSMAIFVATVCW